MTFKSIFFSYMCVYEIFYGIITVIFRRHVCLVLKLLVVATFFLVNISAFAVNMATAAPTSEQQVEIPQEKLRFDVWYHIAQVSV